MTFKYIEKRLEKKDWDAIRLRELQSHKNNVIDKELFDYLKTRHSWHLVDPSPWPFVAALGAFFMTSGGVLYMHNYSGGGVRTNWGNI